MICYSRKELGNRPFSAVAKYLLSPMLSGMRGAKYSSMKTQIPAEIIVVIAQVIGRCDFRTTVSLYTTATNSPWIITVGESSWQRHLIVERVEITPEGVNADLGILPSTESSKFGYDIRTNHVDRRIKLSELIANRYIGVKKVLFPTFNQSKVTMPEIFAKGDKVRTKKNYNAGSGLSEDQVYNVGYVQDLLQPNEYHTDPRYWDEKGNEEVRGKTRLQTSGHPQIVFLDGVLRPEMDIPPANTDPEGLGRRSFSGAWFEKVS